MYAFPVVVAPPYIVRPPAWVPEPMVEDADDMSPDVNRVSAEKTLVPLQVLLSESKVEDALVVGMQVPLMAKQPDARSMPRAKVEVALVPVTFRYVVSTPAPKVEVAEPRMVVVAVPPTYRRSKMERRDVDAVVEYRVVAVRAVEEANGIVVFPVV